MIKFKVCIYKLNVHTYRTVKLTMHKANDYRIVVIISGILFMWIKQTITWNEYTYIYANLSAISLLPVTSSHAGSTCVVEEWVGENNVCINYKHALEHKQSADVIGQFPIHMYGLYSGWVYALCLRYMYTYLNVMIFKIFWYMTFCMFPVYNHF